MDSSNPPNTGKNWISLNPGTQFQPAESGTQLRTAQHRDLRYHDKFVDGHETYYDAYSQAWRLLGFYVDCDSNNQNDARKLEDGGNGCQRYLLWAAYVDLNYQGGGLGEYQIYDQENGWQKDACEATESERCVKMDCHQGSSNFKLLGYYKETSYDDWFEQLFKHEGYCIWSEDEYYFMDKWRASWPQGCTQSSISAGNGSYLYYDLKPMTNAEIGIGLYTDAYCTVESNKKVDLSQFFQACGDGDDGCSKLSMSVNDFMKKFNGLLNVYKTCLPCKAFDLSVTSNQNSNDHGGQDGDNDPNNGLFQCDDDAGYTNVNQCMKFGSQTELISATFADVRMASQQGTILRPLSPGTSISRLAEANRKNGFFIFSILFFVCSVIFLVWANRRARRQRRSRVNAQPLL